MPGVSSRAPVAGEFGIGKVYLKFKPKKVRKTSLTAIVVWSCFASLMYFQYAWPKPNLRYGVVVPVLRAGCAAFDFVFNYNVNKPTIEVSRDSNGVPFLHGSDLARTIYLQGYAHASDRLYQMDVLRRSATGQLSELFGNRTIETDKQSRSLSFYDIANRDLEKLTNDEFNLLLSYSNGVNQFIDDTSSGTLAVQYARIPEDFLSYFGYELNYKHPHIEKWEPVHTLAVMRLLAYQWSSGWEQQLLDWVLNPEDALKSADKSLLPSLSGNSFVVSGKHTKSGAALLASDFHAQVSVKLCKIILFSSYNLGAL